MRYGAFFLLILTWQVQAQGFQTVRGTVKNKSGQFLSGVHVFLMPDSTHLAQTDAEGRFELKEVTVGRSIIVFKHIGYITYEEELLVTAAKSVFLDVVLRERSQMLERVEVVSGQAASLEGAYVISIEKTLRVPANFFDPLRMTATLPGVTSTSDQTNGISLRGYSPNGLLWRLNGLDIVNPNHLANAGTLSDRPVANGGGVSILSAQVLDKTDFEVNGFSPSTGNVLSGAIDMHFRKGNSYQKEHTIQAGLIGMDIATEGPISSNANSSYLVNYRYSTVGLLTSAGVDFGGERINFNDLTFNLDFRPSVNRERSVFGFSGISSNKFSGKSPQEWETEKDRYAIDFSGKTFGFGLKEQIQFKPGTSFRFGLAVSAQSQKRDAKGAAVPIPNLRDQKFKSDRTVISLMGELELRILESIKTTSGIIATQTSTNLSNFNTNSFGLQVAGIDGEVKGWLLQPYSGWEIQAGALKIFPTLRYTHFTFNSSGSFDPRLSLKYPFAKGMLFMGYGRVSQIQQAGWYLSVPGNEKLSMTRADQFNIGFMRLYTNGMSWRLQGYEHRLRDVASGQWDGLPLSIMPYSTLNLQEEIPEVPLFSNGIGRNRGLEFMIEKRFDNNLYLLASASIYQAKFGIEGTGQLWRGRFDGRFTGAMAAGREWKLRKNAFGVNVRTLTFGGQRERLIDAAASAGSGFTQYDPLSNFSIVIPDYHRIDLRVAWRKNKPGRTRTFSIDIQNLIGRENAAGYYFDTYLQKVVARKQLGIIPVINWRVDF